MGIQVFLHIFLLCELLVTPSQSGHFVASKKQPNDTPGEDKLPTTCPKSQRCCGRYGDPNRPDVPTGRRCCTPENPCDEGEGDCNGHAEAGGGDGNLGCKAGLVCGSNNCRKFGRYYNPSDDCCEKPGSSPPISQTYEFTNVTLTTCPSTHKCCGRFGDPNRPEVPKGRRCCTPENPCDEGEGDCNPDIEGPPSDGNLGCKRGLICGKNNCKKFALYFHDKDDCCEKPNSSKPFEEPTTPKRHHTKLHKTNHYATTTKPKHHHIKQHKTYSYTTTTTPTTYVPLHSILYDMIRYITHTTAPKRHNTKLHKTYHYTTTSKRHNTKLTPTLCQPGWSEWSEWSCVGRNTRERKKTCKKEDCSLGYHCVINMVNGSKGCYLPQRQYNKVCKL